MSAPRVAPCAIREIPVENSKGEAAIGQHELNVRYADALTMADRHVVMKQAMKELADAQGVSVTFMAKPTPLSPAASATSTSALWTASRNAFVGRRSSGPTPMCSAGSSAAGCSTPPT